MLLHIYVQPSAAQAGFIAELELPGDKFGTRTEEVTARKYKLKSAPEDGKANQELIELIASDYKVSKSQVKIKKGLGSRYKIVEIS